ncbi:MAG: biotin--[acetyl-CoA-carboxylase] ligase, partial [Oscillospiraceae bacterium]|nr:biotin--[acetyl-CoA-carboxylase] ligase [Oscillospiraceae bacterium]
AGIADSFMGYYNDIGNRSYFESYEKRLMWKDEPIDIISPAGTKKAVLRGIDDECRLIVEYPDGTEGIVSSGEISIRKK